MIEDSRLIFQRKTSWRPLLGGAVNFPLCLAPMVGLSHVVLRRILRSYLPTGAQTLWPTEMLNSRRLGHEVLGATPETLKAEDEDLLVPQLLGNEPEPIRVSIQALKNWGASAIDINMGCSVAKALKHNYGVSLMGQPDYAAEVVGMAKEASELPVSVKLRAGFQNDSQLLKKFVQGLESAGASWLTLHPRTASQLRRGSADWTQIKFVRDQVRCPVLGNGDVQTLEDVFSMVRETECDTVMVGRALAARPWMLWQLGQKMGFDNPPQRFGPAPCTNAEEGAEYGRVLKQFLSLCRIHFAENIALRKFRFYVRTTAVWLPFGQSLISLSSRGRSLDELTLLVNDFFRQEITMSQRTELRQ